ncbi:MAG TPA: lipocalin-like domain-containing protein [Dongiaceae bacterium]|jgi:hypothetical protein|nr:lipocalin-like domain-containing protein [Dongiaceae bacterium]
MAQPNPLLGTWRVESFERRENGALVQPLGSPPAGYAVFDETGHAFVQLGRATTPDRSPKEIAQSLMAYFGPYAIDGDQLTVTVEASNMAAYIGSTQVRRFRRDGDALTIGVEGQYQAKLRRVTA